MEKRISYQLTIHEADQPSAPYWGLEAVPTRHLRQLRSDLDNELLARGDQMQVMLRQDPALVDRELARLEADLHAWYQLATSAERRRLKLRLLRDELKGGWT